MSMKEFGRIIGYSFIRKELEQIADTLKNGEVYARLGVSAPKGLILHGEPGVGKTLMASCVIEASQRKSFVCRKNQPNGDFVKSIKETFNQALENAPSIVFLDDMDKFANGDELHRDEEEYVTVQSCIDEVKDKDVFVLATANNLRCLPCSLLRAGRFDRIIEVGAPKGQDAINIIEHYLKGKSFVNIDVKSISRILNGHSCAELETLINEAGLYAGFERSEHITMEHFMKACMQTIFNVPAKSFEDDIEDWYADLNDSNNISTQIVYHEAGHAVISEVMRPESVTLISAHGHKGSFGGFTAYYHDENENPAARRKRNVVVNLGGMAALEQRFGIYDCGASRDLDQAFAMISDMVKEECVCGFSLHEGRYDASEDLHKRQEQAAAIEIEKYYRKAKEIISLNREFFERIAAELAQKRLLHTADIQRIKAECNIVAVNV